MSSNPLVLCFSPPAYTVLLFGLLILHTPPFINASVVFNKESLPTLHIDTFAYAPHNVTMQAVPLSAAFTEMVHRLSLLNFGSTGALVNGVSVSNISALATAVYNTISPPQLIESSPNNTSLVVVGPCINFQAALSVPCVLPRERLIISASTAYTSSYVGVRTSSFAPADAFSITSFTVTATSSNSISLSWILPSIPFKTLELQVSFDTVGDALSPPSLNPGWLPFQNVLSGSNTSAVTTLSIIASISPNATSFVVQGCFFLASGQRHCISPFTIYRISLYGHGLSINFFSRVYLDAQTAQGPPGPPIIIEEAGLSNQVLVAAYEPLVATGVYNSFVADIYDPYEDLSYQSEIKIDRFCAIDPTQRCIDLFRILPLNPFTNYTMAFALVSQGGIGTFTRRFTYSTLQDVPGPPSNPTLVKINATFVKLSWNLPNGRPRGIITAYQVTVSFPPAPYSFPILNGSDTRTLLMDFSFTQYPIRVRAYTVVGPGPYSDAAEFVSSSAIENSSSLNQVGLALVIAAVVFTATVILVLLIIFLLRRRRILSAKNFVLPVADEWDLPRSQLTLVHSLGQGAFGTVWEAHFYERSTDAEYQR